MAESSGGYQRMIIMAMLIAHTYAAYISLHSQFESNLNTDVLLAERRAVPMIRIPKSYKDIVLNQIRIKRRQETDENENIPSPTPAIILREAQSDEFQPMNIRKTSKDEQAGEGDNSEDSGTTTSRKQTQEGLSNVNPISRGKNDTQEGQGDAQSEFENSLTDDEQKQDNQKSFSKTVDKSVSDAIHGLVGEKQVSYEKHSKSESKTDEKLKNTDKSQATIETKEPNGYTVMYKKHQKRKCVIDNDQFSDSQVIFDNDCGELRCVDGHVKWILKQLMKDVPRCEGKESYPSMFSLYAKIEKEGETPPVQDELIIHERQNSISKFGGKQTDKGEPIDWD